MKNLFKVIIILWSISPIKGFTQTDWFSYTNGHKVVDVVKDSSILWIATTGGLVKVDSGTSDTIFLTKSNADFKTYNITAIELDLQHNIWIGTDGNGIFKYDGLNWIQNPYGINLPTQHISDIKKDLTGNIWVGCKFWLQPTYPNLTPHFGGLVMYNGNTWTNFTSHLNSNNIKKDVYKIECDNQGKVLIGDGALVTYDGTNWQYYHPNGNTSISVTKFTTDTLNNVWLLQDSSTLSMFNGNNWTNFPVTPGITSNFFYYHTIITDSVNNIWIGSDVNDNIGLLKFDGSTWSNYTTSNSNLSENRISCLYHHLNQIFIGVNPYGLNILSTNLNYKKIITSNSLIYENWLETVYLDTSGIAYTSSFNSITDKVDLVSLSGQTWNFLDNIPTGTAKAIYRDSNNNIWVGGYKGVAFFNGTNWSFFNISNTNFPHNTVNSIAEDINGSIWIAGGSAYKSFIAKYDGITWTTYFPPGVPYEFYKIIIDTLDNKWIGAYDGLYEFDNQNKWQAYTNFNGPFVTDNHTFDVAFAKNSNAIWLATSRGLFKKNLSIFKQISYTWTESLAIDMYENVWTSPLSSDSLNVYNQNGEFIETFTSDNSGLPNIPYVNSIAISKEGKVYMATRNGLVLFTEGNTVNESETNKSKVNVNIYPNPNNGTFTIDVNLIGDQIIDLFDINGRHLFNKTINKKEVINVSDLSEGFYSLRIKDKKSYITKKIVIVR